MNVSSTNNEISPQQIYIEDTKASFYQAAKQNTLDALDDVLERIAMRRENTEPMKTQRLTDLLKSSVRGKVATGDTVDGLVKLLVASPLFQHLHNLNNPALFNIENSAIDFGERPVMIYGRGLCKSVGNPLVPRSEKNRLVVEYSECSPQFNIYNAYETSALEDNRVSREEFAKTMKGAEEVVRPFKGRATRNEICFLLSALVGLVLVLALGIALGRLISYIITIVVCVVFLIAITGIFIYLRKHNRKLVIYGHLALALYARCENNRCYLRKKVLVRPGYMAKWIEFNSLSLGGNSTIEAL